MEPDKTSQVTNILKKLFAHARDVSLRDGVQSWDANMWKIDDILSVLEKINGLAKTAKADYGIDMQPIEIWGGGQVAQPAKFLGENPLHNLGKIEQVAKDLTQQCLYRGRQCFGFKPVSKEVQKAAIKAAADRGMKVFRIFDMMNDGSNVDIGIEAMRELRAQGGKYSDIKIEGAVSYISEPGTGPRAWEKKDYVRYALELAGKGCDSLVIKNYAGVGDSEMLPLVNDIRKALDGAGHKDMAISMHTHGEKPELLKTLIDGGVDKVDVAFGELAGGPSHTNIRSLLNLYLAEAGINANDEAVTGHPLVQQIAAIEESIATVVHRRDLPPKSGANGTGVLENFDDRRAPLKRIEPEDIEHYRMAGGALSDLANRLRGYTDEQLASTYEKHKDNLALEPLLAKSKDELFHKALDYATTLWEKGGRFNTVTPGAKILVEQMTGTNMHTGLITMALKGQEPNMSMYTDDYIDLVVGRYGVNQGMDRGIGDQKFRDALLMYRALKQMEALKKQGKIFSEHVAFFPKHAEIGNEDGNFRQQKNRMHMRNGSLDLAHPELEEVLKASDIEKFRHAVEHVFEKQEDVKQQLLATLKPGKSAEPTEGLDAGDKKIRELLRLDGEPLAEEHATYPLLAMILPLDDLKNMMGLNNGHRGMAAKPADKTVAI